MRITEQIGSSFEANVPATDGDADGDDDEPLSAGSLRALPVARALPLAALEQVEDDDEEIDDVQVDVERRDDVVVQRVLRLLVAAADHQLDVVDEEEREHEAEEAVVNHVCKTADLHREEPRDEHEADHRP